MKPLELEQTLRELKEARSTRQPMLWRAICGAIDEPWFDVTSYARVEQIGLALGFKLPPRRPAVLGVGEAWLLLFDAARDTGVTGRLRLVPGTATDAQLSETGLNAMLDAHFGLSALVSEMCRRLPADAHPRSCRVELPAYMGSVEGRSLGLATAIALVSAGLARPACSDVAASAIVTCQGELRPVTHLREKLEDLARRRPEVACVLVAAGQELPSSVPTGIEIRPCTSLQQALTAADLKLTALPKGSLEAFRSRVGQLREQESALAHTPERWLELAREAHACAHALRSDPACRDTAAESLAWAALFALHSGRFELAGQFQEQVSELGLSPNPAVAAWLAIVSATKTIDLKPHEAARAAEDALAQVQRLEPRDRDPILGQAFGTLGRAHLHSGAPQAGVPFLRNAVAHHTAHARREEPRSMTYLATCLRHAGDLDEAARVINDAFVRLERLPGWDVSGTTELYARLERGRCALARGNAVAAANDFEFVMDGQETDEQHPRISAVRGLAAAHRLLGNADRAHEYLARCVRVARTSKIEVYRELGAMAVGDALLASELVPTDLRDLWREVTGVPGDEHIREFVSHWIY